MPRRADDVIGSEDAVAAQARMFDTPGTPWYAVSKGTFADIQKIWPNTPCCRPHHRGVSLDAPCALCGCTADVFVRGPVGENVLHLAVLFHTPESVKMAKYLIKRFGPSLLNAPYQTRRTTTSDPGLYEGEVALHIAIVHKDLDLVQFMLRHGARLDTHAIGGFFQPGRVYFGETPFAFACSIGDKRIVKALLDHSLAIGGEKKKRETMTSTDQFGNTGLHMCVTNNQLEMYRHLVDELKFPEHVKNNAGMTPFVLAAHDGNQTAFAAILRRRFSVVWTYGPVTNYSLSLTDIDTVGSDPHAHDSSVIDVILKRNHLQLLNHPILVAVLDMKWNAFGRKAFMLSMGYYIVFLCLFTWQVEIQVTQRGSVSEWHSGTRTTIEWVTFLLSLLMLLQHARDLLYFTRAYYRQLDTLRVNSQNSDVPLFCVPGAGVDKRINKSQLPRALRVVIPRKGTAFSQTGDAPTESSRISLESIHPSILAAESGQQSSSITGTGLKPTRRHKKTENVVFVLAKSINARRRWRILREHWMSTHKSVRLHQIARQMKLQHCDDYDDGVTCLLHVNVLEARNLPPADKDGSADPYCVVTACTGSRLRTKCCSKTLSPVWGQTFSFTAPPGIRRSSNKVTLTIMDRDEYDFDDEMAVTTVAFADVPYIAAGMIPPGPVWLPLRKGENTGDDDDETGSGISIVKIGRGLKSMGRDTLMIGVSGVSKSGDGSLGEVLVEVYYEVVGVGKDSGSGELSVDATEASDETQETSILASTTVSKLFTDVTDTVATETSHTGFLRGVGVANQERAVVRRLGRIGYTLVDDVRLDVNTSSGSGNDSNSEDSDQSDDEDAAKRDTDSTGKTNVPLKNKRSVKTLFKRFKLSATHAQRALLFYVNSVLVPQPSLLMNLTHIVLQTTHFLLWQRSVWTNTGPSSWDDVVFACAALAAWGFTLYFAAGYRSVGFLTVIVVGCIKDVIRLSSLWCVVMFAFSQAFYVLDASWADSNSNLWNSSTQGEILWRLFSVAITTSNFDDVFPGDDTSLLNVKTVYTLLGVLYQVLMSMLMLNVIIAMFNQTYARVSAMAHEQWRMQWALKILLAEAQLSVSSRFELRLGEDAVGKNGEKTRVHYFEINAGGEEGHQKGSIAEAVTVLLKEKQS